MRRTGGTTKLKQMTLLLVVLVCLGLFINTTMQHTAQGGLYSSYSSGPSASPGSSASVPGGADVGGGAATRMGGANRLPEAAEENILVSTSLTPAKPVNKSPGGHGAGRGENVRFTSEFNGGGGGGITRSKVSHALLARPKQTLFTTVQTGGTRNWCRMLLSAALSQYTTTSNNRSGHSIAGMQIHNIGWGQKYAHSKRPAWILDWIAGLQQLTTSTTTTRGSSPPRQPLEDNDLLFFNDGSDAIFSGINGYIDVVDKFLDIEARTGTSMLYNAEANCYHQQSFSGSWGAKKGRCLSAYKRYNPFVTSKFRYLNGGGWIGRVFAVKQIMLAAKQRFDADKKLWCDQSVFGTLLLSKKFHPLLDLDYDNAIFLPTYHLRTDTDICSSSGNSHHGDNDDDDNLPPQGAGGSPSMLPSSSSSVQPPALRMCHSGETPALLHFNGKSEGVFTLDVMKRTSWYPEAKKAQEALRGGSSSQALLNKLGVNSASTVLGKKGGNNEEVSLASVCVDGFGI